MPLSLASSSTRMAAGLHRLASTSRGAAALRAVGRSAGLVPRRGGAMVFPRPALSRGLAVKASMADDVKAKNAKYPVIVYSKTYCPYCTEVKTLFKTLSVPATIVELDALADGDAVAAGVQEVTGRRTVPQVFIGGAHVGGCDDTVAAHKSGELKKMLAGVGISV